jgi:hypothetical protein
MKIKFNDLKIGDWIRFNYMGGDFYVTDIDYENRIFKVCSPLFLSHARLDIPEILSKGEFEIIGVSIKVKHNWLKRLFINEFLHPFELRKFTETEIRLMELIETKLK